MSAPLSTPTDTDPAAAAAIRVENLAKRYSGGVQALDGINLTVRAGELVALIGANGSGKSTLLKILFGVVGADSGEIRVLGLHPRRDQASARAQIGYAAQEPPLDPETRGWETLRLFHALRRLPPSDRSRRLDELADDYELRPFCDRKVGTYSGGERQRLHLALETMHNPRLLLLDEPTSSLDPTARRALWKRLRGWRDAGQSVVVATHDLPDVATNCDRAVLFKQGTILADDHPDVLIASYSGACTVVTLSERMASDVEDSLRNSLRNLPDVRDLEVDGRTLKIWRERHPDGGEPALELIASHGLTCQRFEHLEADLATAYFRLTGTALDTEGRGQGATRGMGRGRRR